MQWLVATYIHIYMYTASYVCIYINNKPLNGDSITSNVTVLLLVVPIEGGIIQVISKEPGFVVISTKVVLPLTDGCN